MPSQSAPPSQPGSDDPVHVAGRMAGIQYAVRDVVLVAEEAAAAGKELLYLNIGDPNQFDFDTPPHLIDAIVNRGLRARRNGYTPSSGIPEAIEAIATYARESKGIQPVLDVFVGNGASEPIEIALTALLDPGDNILTPTPGYPLYTAVLAKIGAEANPYLLDEDDGWQPSLDDIEARINDRTRAIVVINPNNPTGSVASRATMQRIVDLCVARNLVMISDEIYDRLLFDGAEHVSPGSLSPELMCLTFNGLSKVYFGPGLRMGWCISSGPEARIAPLIAAMHKLTRARLCASAPVQYGIAPALTGNHDFLAEATAKLVRRRDITYQRLNAIPRISCVKPRGTFYAFPRLDVPDDDVSFVKRVIRETGVVLVHGSGFGAIPNRKHVRVVFLPEEDILNRSFDKLDTFMRSHYGSA